MSGSNANFDIFEAELARLTPPGVIGLYTHFEIIEIFAFKKDDPTPLNVFSIFVAEELEKAVGNLCFLGDRIKLKSLKDWFFGIQQYVRPISHLQETLDHFKSTHEWRPSGERLSVGSLVPVPTHFVPPDSTMQASWNGVLKNNFWSGSYVLECAGIGKAALQPLFDEPPRLQELSDFVQERIPIRLAGLTDRLGNLVVQLPVTVLIANFAKGSDAIVKTRWHRKATPRPIRASSEKQFDNIISGYASTNVETLEAVLPINDGQGVRRDILWDDRHQVILAATGSTGFVSTIGLNFEVSDPEPRVFTITDKDGNEKPIRVGISSTRANGVEAARPDRGEAWTRRRIYRDEATRLAAERRFVQYKPASGSENAEHEKALEDIRILLNQYGKEGAWLWDPYLSADDVIRTLFYCKHFGADLRALTAGYEPPPSSPARSVLSSIGQQLQNWLRERFSRKSPQKPTFREKQRAAFAAAKSNFYGLRLEYRVRTGSSGWAFHDRFSIFPCIDSGAFAWSLGTSINSLGKQHQILQQVDDGQLVMDAFNELWGELNQPEHLIWKTP
jgi:hypothetical protein